jgi:hypothetical protein
MTSIQFSAESAPRSRNRTAKATAEAAGLLRAPYRIFPLLLKVGSDKIRTTLEQRGLYAYVNTSRQTDEALRSVIAWIRGAQRPDGGIAAYYSLLSGYAESYPEVTGYLIPTLYEFGQLTGDENALRMAEKATRWLLLLQLPSGAFPGGFHGAQNGPSVFNTGQVLHGLLRAYAETGNPDILRSATTAGDWLAEQQREDGAWAGLAAYQQAQHTYYSMVAWALGLLGRAGGNERHARAAERNLDWVLPQFRLSGWVDGINLRGYPTFLHFIAYVIQGVLECGILLRRNDAVEAASRSAWVLLRRFETHKRLAGAYAEDFKVGEAFACLTGNAQMSCVWLRLFETTGELRYLNAGLKMNEMLKQVLPARGRRGVVGGVAGSYPAWGPYQPMRYISWGCKFMADALMLEQKLMGAYEASQCAS